MTHFEEVPMPQPAALVKSAEWEDAARKRQSFNGWRADYGDADLGLYTADQLRAYGQQCRPAPCPWTPDADGYWKTACRKSHAFTDGGPTENNHRFCCYCGGAITKENGDAAN